VAREHRWQDPAALFEAALANADSASPDAADSAAWEAERVGPYRLVERVGEGGMGVVYRAWDDRLRRHVALKHLKRGFGTALGERERLLDEARVASALDHPNICTVHDVGETSDRRLFIVMAYHDGPTLSEKIADGPLPVGEALDLASQVARGLARAHEEGVVHRDIKPSNVILDQRGRAHILDFGLAQVDEQTADATGHLRVGTPAYMSPEQESGATVAASSDIWSLGAVLWELLSGRRIRRGSDQATDLASLREDVPPAAVALVERCLAHDPSERFRSAADLADELERVIESSSDSSHSAFRHRGRVRLPSPLSSFVGRDRERVEIRELLERHRLVTLTGPGGTGKTRLAVAVAHDVADRFTDGAFFVDLAQVEDTDLVAPAVTAALGISYPPSQTPERALVAAMRSQHALLVLDNCEQIIDAAPGLAQTLAACPRISVLVTSRLLLYIDGEQAYPVPPLSLPPPESALDSEAWTQSSAVALFTARARANDPSFTVSSHNAEAVHAICRRLDGLPLAIELAAAQLRLFSPQTLAQRVEESLDLLTAKSRSGPRRHQTLRHALAWSHDLLPMPGQRIFRRLAVFAGGADFQAVAAVTPLGDTPDAFEGLDALVDHSLVRRETHDDDGAARFSMLVVTRHFAHERLEAAGELEATSRAHARYYRSLADRLAQGLKAGDQARILRHFRYENDNLRAALSWAEKTGDTETGLAMATSLFRFWLAQGQAAEGESRLGFWLRSPRQPPVTSLGARALRDLGILVLFRGGNEEARSCFARALDIWQELEHGRGIARELNNLAWAENELGHLDAGEALSARAIAANRELDDQAGVAIALNNLGWAALYRGQYPRAQRLFRDCLAIRRDYDDELSLAFALTNLAWTKLCLGRLAEAESLIDEAWRILERLGDKIQLGWAGVVRGCLCQLNGDLGEAQAQLEKAYERLRHLGSGAATTWAIDALGYLLGRTGRFARATELARTALESARESRSKWGEPRADALLGWLAARQTKNTEATRLLSRSLAPRLEVGDWGGAAQTLEALAEVLLAEGEHLRAVEHLAAATHLRSTKDAPLTVFQQGDLEAAEAALRRRLSAEAFEQAWAAGLELGPTRPPKP
jgi:non-specific serine/threonine protein kinase